MHGWIRARFARFASSQMSKSGPRIGRCVNELALVGWDPDSESHSNPGRP